MRARWVFGGILVVLVGVSLLVYVTWNSLRLTWRDAPRELRVTVSSSRPSWIGRCSSSLEVTIGNDKFRTQLDDDARLGDVKLVRYENWVLVVSDNLVLGGYDTERRILVGENEWDQLPFTVWQGGGTVLARKRFFARSLAPASFPMVSENKTKNSP